MFFKLFCPVCNSWLLVYIVSFFLFQFQVRAIHQSHLESQYEDPEAISGEVAVHTKDTPGTVKPENITSTSVTLHWISLEPESSPARISIEYRVVSVFSDC